jgi:hypothetical protein
MMFLSLGFTLPDFQLQEQVEYCRLPHLRERVSAGCFLLPLAV